jgi:hypothetical protein
MRLNIKHDWGKSFEDGAGFVHSIGLGVEDGAANGLFVRVEERVHAKLDPTPPEAAATLTERFILVLLDRLAHLGDEGVAGLLETVNGRLRYYLDLTLVDGDEPRRLSALKRCQHQFAERGDLFCAAASWPVEQADAVPVTRHKCNTCAMPDARVSCVHLHHPRMVHSTGGEAPRFAGAECDIGRGEVAQPDKCRPGGHGCWACAVPMAPAPSVVTSPLALHEHLDFMDSVWRNVFGEHLLRVRAATVAGKLATPCESQQDFEVKLSALADLLNSLEVSDALLVEADKASKDYEKGRTLARVTSALRRRFTDEEDGPGMEEAAVRHIGVLRDAMGLRRGYQHTGSNAAGRLPEMFGRFGLTYPLADPVDAWSRVRGKVVTSLAALRDIVRELER